MMGIIPGMGVTEHESASGSKYYEYGGEYYNNYDDIPFATKQAYETTKEMVGDYFTTEWNKIPEPGQHLLRGAAGLAGKVFNYADKEFFYGGVSETLSAVDKGFTAASEVIERETGLYAPTAKVGSELAVDYLLTGGGGKILKGGKAIASQADDAITSAARTLFPQPEPVLVEGLLQGAVKDRLKSSSTVIPNTMYAATATRTAATTASTTKRSTELFVDVAREQRLKDLPRIKIGSKKYETLFKKAEKFAKTNDGMSGFGNHFVDDKGVWRSWGFEKGKVVVHNADSRFLRGLRRSAGTKLDEKTLLKQLGGDQNLLKQYKETNRKIYRNLNAEVKKLNIAGRKKHGKNWQDLQVEHIFDVQFYWKIADEVPGFAGRGANEAQNLTIIPQRLNAQTGAAASKLSGTDALVKNIDAFPDMERVTREFVDFDMFKTVKNMKTEDWEGLTQLILENPNMTAHELIVNYF